MPEDPDLLKAWDREAKGIPIGRPAEVRLVGSDVNYAMDGRQETSIRINTQGPPK
ncbi:MAG: hypothetical protein LQ350_008399 [Teloschistes chrysophthalmus]|nr:MAG: hypothetical protein LQ350_008399 [Niorma chrysophthalma]